MSVREPISRRGLADIDPSARVWTILAVAAVVLGCVLRVLRWIDDPSLWLDEAFLAINLMDKSFADMLGSLQFLQSAPPGFLLLEKSAETLLGDSERSLRLLPLLASVASVGLFAYVARRMLAAAAAALAIVLFAVGEPLLERAAEIKPYSVDVAVSALLLALTLWTLSAPPDRILRRVALLGALGLGALWLSFPAVFSLAASIAALGVHALEIRSRRLLVAAGALGAVSLATFGGVYAVASSNVSRISSAIFGEGDDSAVGSLAVLEDAWSTFVNPGGFENGTHALAALLACFGAFALARRGSLHLVALFTVPPLLALFAAAVDKYPLGGRFSLFLVPFLLVLVGRGAQALVGWSRRPLVVSLGLAAFLVVPPVAIAVNRAVDPPAREDLRPLLSHLIREWKDGDVLYVYPNSQYALRYYATCEDCTPSGKDFPWPNRVAPPSDPAEQFAPALESVPPRVIVGAAGLEGTTGDLPRLQQASRVWLLFSHVRSHSGLDDEQVLLTGIATNSKLVASLRARGARLYLFQRSPA